MATEFNIGDEVQRISDPTQIGTVVEVCGFYGGVQYYRVQFGGGHRLKVQGTDLQVYDPADDPVSALVKGQLTGSEDLQRLITQQRLLRDHPLRNNIYAFNTSRIRFYPYQFKPLLKFLDSHQNRLLIADEVGLGKTIEAGLILLELKARQTFQRVLVVCPAALRDKWQLELRQRFGGRFASHSKKTFLDFLDEFESDPDTTEFAGILSYESCRLADSLSQLEEIGPDFDLVIFDEAHHMRNFGTKTREAGQLLCTGARSVLF